MGKKKKRAKSVKWFYLSHWVSGALCLVSMVFFGVTGITLNHADDWQGEPVISERSGVVPEGMRGGLVFEEDGAIDREVPKDYRRWVEREFGVDVGDGEVEWSEYDLYVNCKRPGGNSWVSVDFETFEVDFEETNRGGMAFVNDLHRGLYTGGAWSWFLDIFGVATCVFTLTGLGLLWVHAKRRKSTWFLVIGGVVVPVILVILMFH